MLQTFRVHSLAFFVRKVTHTKRAMFLFLADSAAKQKTDTELVRVFCGTTENERENCAAQDAQKPLHCIRTEKALRTDITLCNCKRNKAYAPHLPPDATLFCRLYALGAGV